MKASIFYSWQSDADKADCQYFIRDALKMAIALLKRNDELVAPRLDHDTKDVPGMPDVAATILEKVSGAGVFVADLTLVARAGEKKCPNPNVAVELGYAAAEIGWSRTIGVMNTGAAFGKPDELIFDLIHKRHPIQYEFAAEVNRDAVQKKLAADLAAAIKAILRDAHVQAERLIGRLDARTYTFLTKLGSGAYFNLGPLELVLQPQVIRLLDLGMLRYDHSVAENKYAYHWTYIGRLVLDRLGITEAKPQEIQPAKAPAAGEPRNPAEG